MKRGLVWSAIFCLAAWGAPAWAQLSNDGVKIGVATDMSSLYADINGPGAVIATQMAIDDFGGTVGGKKIELVTGDIQNKADVAATLAGRWYDADGVDMIMGAGASSSSIAIEGIAGQKHKIFLAPDPASSDMTGKLCNPYTIHWVYDTAALANGTGSAVVAATSALFWMSAVTSSIFLPSTVPPKSSMAIWVAMTAPGPLMSA